MVCPLGWILLFSFFKKLSPENVYIVESVEQAIATAKTILSYTNLM
ncbi:hypothetical protein [Nostoc sp. DedQUE09]|nr:hypothetical protein [Nostoc sp. DedQUE09]MDZ7954121.1 hypothetical protein [Nostoc sp. DedQUE09]